MIHLPKVTKEFQGRLRLWHPDGWLRHGKFCRHVDGALESESKKNICFSIGALKLKNDSRVSLAR